MDANFNIEAILALDTEALSRTQIAQLIYRMYSTQVQLERQGIMDKLTELGKFLLFQKQGLYFSYLVYGVSNLVVLNETENVFFFQFRG